MSKPKKKIFGFSEYVIIPIISALIVIILTQEIFFSIKPLKELELKYIDIRFSERKQKNIKDSADVIILGVSQSDYDQIPNPYNTWPWPRSYFARVVNNLNDAGVQAIGIDILMANDDTYSYRNDEDLVDAIRTNENVVVAGVVDIVAEGQQQDGDYSVVNKQYNYRNKFLIADSSIGIVQLGSDEDGIYRRYKPFVISDANKRVIPTFGFAVLNKYYNVEKNSTASVRDKFFKHYNKKIPKYDPSSMLINYYGPNGSFKYFNFTDILDDDSFQSVDESYYETTINMWSDPEHGLLQSGIFKDKIVLIGSVLPEDGDLHPVSYSLGRRKGDNQMWGVEIHANAIQNIIWEDFIYKQSKASEVILIFIISFLSFLAFSIFKRHKRIHPLLSEIFTLALLFLTVVLTYLFGIYLFAENNYMIAFISPVTTFVSGYLSTSIYYALKILKQNTMIKGMFQHYVSKPLVDELLSDPERLSLGGEKKKITILFSDIEGFTSISEAMTPEELVDFVNSYLHIMTGFVLENNGTLDKYLGDSLMAFWGAPLEVENQELKACKTALLMQKKIIELKSEWEKSAKKEVRARIGINTDDVVVGNIGGNERFDYTVMGDGVNLTSRLESANKVYGTSILISDSSYRKVANEVLVRVIDKVVVQGKTEPILVYELIGLKDDKDAIEIFNAYSEYIEGYNNYIKRNFEDAIINFRSSLKIIPNDPPSQLYLNRCEEFIMNPPLNDWEGISHLETK
ncbi:MAG: adenylate/guanylate cyclase domain-containing protein [Bacteroidota bacterium]